VSLAPRNTPSFNPCSLWMMPSGRAYIPPEISIGYAFSKDQTYLDAAISSGLDIDEFAPRISFIVSSSVDFFESIAKIRARRRLWARILRVRYGANNPNSWRFRVYYPGSADRLGAIEPLNSIIRAAFQMLASVLGERECH